MRRPLITLAAAGALVWAGCGDTSTNSGSTAAVQQAREASDNLSPEAKGLLEQSQATAAQLAATARSYAGGETSSQQAAQRLEGVLARARAIAKDAQSLPESDGARDDVMRFSGSLKDTAAVLLDKARAGAPVGKDELRDPLTSFRDETRSLYDRYRDQLGRGARDRGQEALDALRGVL